MSCDQSQPDQLSSESNASDADYTPRQRRTRSVCPMAKWTAVRQPEPKRPAGAPQKPAAALSQELKGRVQLLVQKIAERTKIGRGNALHERAAARAQVDRLLLKHGLQMADLEGDKIDVDSEGASCQVDIFPPTQVKQMRMPQWALDVDWAVAELFSVTTWFVKGEQQITFSFCGAAMNAALAADSFIICFVYGQHRASQLPAKSRASYLRGFGTGMLEKSNAHQERQRRDRRQRANAEKAGAEAVDRANKKAAAAEAAEDARKRTQALLDWEHVGTDIESEADSRACSGETSEDSWSERETDYEAEDKQIALYKGNALAFAKRVQVDILKGETPKVHKVNRAAGKKDMAAYEKGRVDGAQCEHRPMKRLKH